MVYDHFELLVVSHPTRENVYVEGAVGPGEMFHVLFDETGEVELGALLVELYSPPWGMSWPLRHADLVRLLQEAAAALVGEPQALENVRRDRDTPVRCGWRDAPLSHDKPRKIELYGVELIEATQADAGRLGVEALVGPGKLFVAWCDEVGDAAMIDVFAAPGAEIWVLRHKDLTWLLQEARRRLVGDA